jgi:hypothetical protein
MLTDRHNRAFNPRFVDDFVNDAQTIANGSPVFLPDGIPDDLNSDGVPDYYPTLYPNAVTAGFLNERDTAGVPLPPGGARPGLTVNFDVLAFPYLFPQAYSVPDPNTTGVGWIHSLDPSVVPAPFAGRPYFGTYLDPPFNHNPLDIGDSEYRFANDPNPPARLPQTWWGFPTWRESAAPYWFGPIRRLNDPPGARYFTSLPPGADPTAETGAGAFTQTSLLSWVRRFGSGPILPPQVDQLYNDGTGGPYFQMPPNAVWEDDLLATNVRSFDVKAYDPAAKMVVGGVVVALPSDYYDLGYANLWGPGAMGLAAGVATPPGMLDSFGHEGRMPPLLEDYRSDAQYPELVPNIGDDNNTVIRMRRVWDSWSTTYTHAPALAVDPNTDPRSGARPVYLSYPAPYPAPLRGIQIRIRITDADGKRVKNLTIRHDFSDKL